MPGQPWDRGRPRPRPRPGADVSSGRPAAQVPGAVDSRYSPAQSRETGQSRATRRRRSVNIGGVATVLTLGLLFAPSQLFRDGLPGGSSAGIAAAPVPAHVPESVPQPGRAPDPSIDRSPGSTDAQLNSPPADISGLADTARSRTVTIECPTSRRSGSAGGSSGDDVTLGSGWPLDPSDLGAPRPTGVTIIVTNGHVVGDCVEDPVVFVEGLGGITARILDVDWDRADEQGLDLAILSIPETIATFPIAREAAVGQWVMAAGSPVGLVGTVTFGAIANRRGTTIFTDAAIGPGNSGGPLFDARGRVIGTNKAVYTDFQGLSIADSIDGLCRRLIRCS